MNSALAVLFADICGSTTLYENLGDDVARQLVADCLDLMVGKLATFQGRLIKTIGDEIMCVFPDAPSALRAASSIQQAVKVSREGAEYPMYVRIGFHYGDVICEETDVFGDTVNVAARVTSITRASQIMTTQSVYESLPSVLAQHVQQLMRTDLKGKQDRFNVYQVTWDFADMQSTRIGTPDLRKALNQLMEMTLRYHGQEFKINKLSPKAILGRSNHCDLVVLNNFASREHVRVELRMGRFFVVDLSTNGTFVQNEQGERIYLIREESALQGKGLISLGQTFDEDGLDTVEFEVSMLNISVSELKGVSLDR